MAPLGAATARNLPHLHIVQESCDVFSPFALCIAVADKPSSQLGLIEGKLLGFFLTKRFNVCNQICWFCWMRPVEVELAICYGEVRISSEGHGPVEKTI